jgi:outer membrane protein OmpA-like peptidoglycan-associated protein
VPATDVIAFTRMGQLWATNWDGSQSRILSAPGRGKAYWFPAAAPDGSCFVAWLSRPDGTQDVVRVELSGRVTQLTDIGETAQPPMKNVRLGNGPTVSPDGKRVAYSFNGNLWIMDANGDNAETLISDGASWSPSFSPNGKTLAYVNGTRGKYDLWITDLESRDTWQVTDLAAYSVGHPRWDKEGKYIVLTRSQGDESDVVQVLATADAPLADADVLTKDKASAGAVFSPSFNRLLFSSERGTQARWVLVSSDPTGTDQKNLGEDTALSPAWLRPGSSTAAVFDASASRPTPVAPKPAPTVAMALPTPMPTAAAPKPAPTVAVAQPTPAPIAATKPVTAAGQPMAAVKPLSGAAKPLTAVAQAQPKPTPQPAAQPTPAGVKPAAAPTQPPLKAAPLRLRYKASFNNDDSLSPAGLADLRKLAPRVRQYESAKVQVIGPLDQTPLRGKYASQEARSKARAQSIANALAKDAGLEGGKVQAQPYSPATMGAGATNSIQIYVEMK